jgi:hypothetical protein
MDGEMGQDQGGQLDCLVALTGSGFNVQGCLFHEFTGLPLLLGFNIVLNRKPLNL